MTILGTWNLIVSTPMGEQASTLTLRDDGTGTTASQLGSSDLDDVKADGDSATFTVKIAVMGHEQVLQGRATANGDSITGSYESPGVNSKFRGQRAD